MQRARSSQRALSSGNGRGWYPLAIDQLTTSHILFVADATGLNYRVPYVSLYKDNSMRHLIAIPYFTLHTYTHTLACDTVNLGTTSLQLQPSESFHVFRQTLRNNHTAATINVPPTGLYLLSPFHYLSRPGALDCTSGRIV